MPTIRELYELHLRELEVVVAQSEMLLQRDGGLDGELRSSGYICEQFVRDTLAKFVVPNHFRLTSGFIATGALLNSSQNLPQCNLLIVDSGVPPIFRFEKSGVEVVPRESVVGIIEVKRTITKTTLFKKADGRESGALAQLNKTLASLNEKEGVKTDLLLNRFNRHVGFHNHSSDKPLLGVIALRHEYSNWAAEVPQQIAEADSPVDFVWAIDGAAVIPAVKNQQLLYYSHTARPITGPWQNINGDDFGKSKSEFYKMYAGGAPIWAWFDAERGNKPSEIFSTMVGVLSLMLSRTFGRPLQEVAINDYYLHWQLPQGGK